MPDEGFAPITFGRFAPAMEKIEPNEAETQSALIDTLHSITETTFEHSGHVVRT